MFREENMRIEIIKQAFMTPGGLKYSFAVKKDGVHYKEFNSELDFINFILNEVLTYGED
jgi:hypothetical protein